MKTVVITGASSGIGKAAAEVFAKAGWNVAATMRNPAKETALQQHKNVKLYALDVTDTTGIGVALQAIQRDFGRIDVVVNNAGYGVDGVFEAMTDDVIQQQFDTNVFGLMRVTREAIKIMRAQKGGTIIQIASMGGRITFPLFSIYHGTKWAVEGFTESLQYEVAPMGIKLRIVEPGAIKTDFYGRSRKFVKPDYTKDYETFVNNAEQIAADAGRKGEDPQVVAQTILKAATATGNRLRYAVGSPAPLILALRKLLPDSWFFGIVRATYKL